MWGVLRPLRRVLRWAAVSALLISISWQKWQHEKSIEMISDRLMDGFIFFQEKFRTNSRRFFFSTFQLVCEPFWSLLVSSLVTITHWDNQQFFVQKFNFDNPPRFSQVFHPIFFWQFFSWNQSCQQLKSPKPQHFHEFFHPNKTTNFSVN